MGFSIRQVAKRADGGDIVRTRSVAQAELSIGRGTDCDIQLADLAVMLRHARLLITAPGKVSVEAIGGVPVAVDGKFVTRADLVLADRPAVDIGPFRLTLAAGEDGGENGGGGGTVAVTAERVVAPSDAADAAQETSIFSLAGALPSKRSMAWAGALVVLIGLLLVPLLHFIGESRARIQAGLPRAMLAQAAQPAADSDGRLALPKPRPAATAGFAADEVWSTGTLSNAHASLSGNCGACHQKAFVSVTDGACQACHTPAALPDHAAPARMAAGRLPESGALAAAHSAFNLPQGRCTSCHKEHEGAATVMTVAANFCTDCHGGLKSRLGDTPVSDVPDWPKHPDFRATLVAAPSLTKPVFTRTALAGAREASGLIYPHALHQSSTNAVANMALKQRLPVAASGALPCNYCHKPDAAQQRFQPISMEANCSACHDLAFARDGGTIRTLPHGKPAQVAGIIRDFSFRQAFGTPTGMQQIAFDRRPPGIAAPIMPGNPAARASAAVVGVFTGKGLCTECHAITDTNSADITRRFAVAPVSLNDHYLPQGRFPHGKHKSHDGKTGEAACTACHTGVLKSKLAADVNIPGVASCRECHGAPAKSWLSSAAKAEASCDTCHAYHDGSVPAGHAAPARPAVVAAVRARQAPA